MGGRTHSREFKPAMECMRLTRFVGVEEYYRRAEGLLLEYEAEHNLILGVCLGAMGGPGHPEQLPYLALVENRGKVVATALMTPPSELLLSVSPSSAPISLIARDLYEGFPELPGVLAPVPSSRWFAEAWGTLTNRSWRRRVTDRIYRLERVTPVSRERGELRRATEEDLDLLSEWLVAFAWESDGRRMDARRARDLAGRRLNGDAEGTYLWEDGVPVSMASYSGPTPNGIRIGRVYTPPGYRGRGYARACVARLSQFLLDSGYKYCFLFADPSNPTANRLYQSIGYRPIGDAEEYEFLPAPTV